MVQVTVIGNDVGQSLKVLKKKMQREGIFREMKLRRCHEKNAENRQKWQKVLKFYKKFDFCIIKLLHVEKKEYIFNIV